MQNTRLFNRIINYLKGKDMLLPSVTSEDEGKTVTVDSTGAWTLGEGGGSGLPSVTDVDDGKVLGVDDGEWQVIEQASPYDAIVHIYRGSASSDLYEFTIAKGNFSSLKAILDTNRMPNILVDIWDEYLSRKGITSMVAVYYYNDELLEFRPKIPTAVTGESANYSIIWGYSLTWYNDNEFELGTL